MRPGDGKGDQTVHLDPKILGNLAWGCLRHPFLPCPSPVTSPRLSDATHLLHLLLLTVGANALKGLFSVVCIPALLLIRLLGLGGVEACDLGAPGQGSWARPPFSPSGAVDGKGAHTRDRDLQLQEPDRPLCLLLVGSLRPARSQGSWDPHPKPGHPFQAHLHGLLVQRQLALLDTVHDSLVLQGT